MDLLMLDPKLLQINLHELTTLRMELGAHGGPEMKVTNIQKSNLSKSFFQKVWMEQIFQINNPAQK